MQILRLALVALTMAIVVVSLTSFNKEIGSLALVAASGIFLIITADLVVEAIGLYEKFAAIGDLGENVLKTVVKITLLCYVSEFAISLIEDLGLRSLADKLAVASKIIIVLTAAPVVTSLIDAVSSFF